MRGIRMDAAVDVLIWPCRTGDKCMRAALLATGRLVLSSWRLGLLRFRLVPPCVFHVLHGSTWPDFS